MIELSHASFRYKGKDATGVEKNTTGVHDVSLSVGQGEFVVLAGNSGCGKTTITRLINGLVPHYYEGEPEGEVRVCGEDIREAGIGALSAHVGSVFQNPRSQFFNVDTTSEMAFVSENRCVEPTQIRADIRRVADEMNIGRLMDRSIFALSGGERQKVACASVAVAEPEVMVLDEPSSNLDAAGIEDLRQVLALWKSKGKTVVVAEHRLYYLTGLLNRLVIMRDGKIVETLESDEVRGMTDEEAYEKGLRAFSCVGVPPELGSSDEAAAPSGHERGSEDAGLVCRDISFRYRGSECGIDIPHLAFRKGEITAILGRNGAGKSTFARVLCGLERKATGSVAFDGRRYKPKERHRLCYMIMQDVNHQLFTESVLEEVMLGMEGGSHEELRARALEVLGRLDLADLADVHPMALSGGQKQRVAIASGVVTRSPVLLFDEPTSGLDLIHMRQVADLLRALRDDSRVVIVITHDTELVREVADRAVWLG